MAQTPLEVSKALAERHRALRKQLNMPQQEMAERSGVSLGRLYGQNLIAKYSMLS